MRGASAKSMFYVPEKYAIHFVIEATNLGYRSLIHLNNSYAFEIIWRLWSLKLANLGREITHERTA